MGFFGIFGSGTKEKEMRRQRFFYPNGDVGKELREIIDESCYEIDKGVALYGWPDLIDNLYWYEGYRKDPAGWEMPAFYRHPVLEILPHLPEYLLPPEDTDDPTSNYYSALADNRCAELNREVEHSGTIWDKITMVLGVGFFCEIVIWGIAYGFKIT